jgi:hypothetical protein
MGGGRLMRGEARLPHKEDLARLSNFLSDFNDWSFSASDLSYHVAGECRFVLHIITPPDPM